MASLINIGSAPRWLNEMRNDHGGVVALDGVTGRIEFEDGYVTRRDAQGNEVEDTHDYKADDARESDIKQRDKDVDTLVKSEAQVNYENFELRKKALETAATYLTSEAGVKDLLKDAAIIERYLRNGQTPDPAGDTPPA